MSPIRPENRDRYPADWPAIRAAILRRACTPGGLQRCECRGECGVDHAATSWRTSGDVYATERDRCGEVNGLGGDTLDGIVVLTIAHLDHTPENCDHANLRAWCQGCHNRYDAPHRLRNRRANAEAARLASGQTSIEVNP